ncbi:MAG: zinc-binding dehydrogenase [Alphaproteobacteria bacterium]|nr:zinc-binding dehydrogenase [Alphaproteobacteria bacterium]
MSDANTTGLELRSLISKSGELELSLKKVPVPEPNDDQVVVKVEASPINPSDLGLLVGPADMKAASASGSGDGIVVKAKVPAASLPFLAARLDQAMPVGNEGAGTVVKAGKSEAAQALKGKTVSMIGGAMYTQYRLIKASDCQALPSGTTAAEGASWFVNPLTSLGMTETMKREGHKALVHTAAASNLGQMLNKICLEDGIGLVSIVRNQAQAKILRDAGAKHVCDSTSASFTNDLTQALVETGATIAFDAIGGGKLASQILTCMEIAINKSAKEYSRYGSSVHKQVYVYGSLDTGPIELTRNYGLAWGVGGWLLTPFLQKIGRADQQRLRERVVRSLKTTFASHYTKTISLPEALDLKNIAVYNKRATGEKFLINPNKAG